MADESKKRRADQEGNEHDPGPGDAGEAGDETPADLSPSEPNGEARSGTGQDADDSGQDAGQSEADEGEGTPQARRLAVSRAELNQLSMGELTVHFRNRSVTFAMDGQSAVRLLSVLVGHRHSVTLDLIDPQKASAFRGWVMVDATEVVGAEWNPLPRPSRVAVDPPGDDRVRTASRAIYEGRLTEDMLLGTPVGPSDLLPVGAG